MESAANDDAGWSGVEGTVSLSLSIINHPQLVLQSERQKSKRTIVRAWLQSQHARGLIVRPMCGVNL